MPGRTLLLGLAALACRPLQPTPAPYSPSSRPDTLRPAGIIRTFYTPALAAAGIPALATSTLPPSYREFRLSQGHGMVLGYFYSVLRIVQSPTQVSGEVWWVRCTPCRAEIAPGSHAINWIALLRQLDSLEIPTIDVPSPNPAITDAGDLIVEYRANGSYRAYDVNAPLEHSEPGYAAARIAFRLIDSVAQLAPWH